MEVAAASLKKEASEESEREQPDKNSQKAPKTSAVSQAYTQTKGLVFSSPHSAAPLQGPGPGALIYTSNSICCRQRTNISFVVPPHTQVSDETRHPRLLEPALVATTTTTHKRRAKHTQRQSTKAKSFAFLLLAFHQHRHAARAKNQEPQSTSKAWDLLPLENDIFVFFNESKSTCLRCIVRDSKIWPATMRVK